MGLPPEILKQMRLQPVGVVRSMRWLWPTSLMSILFAAYWVTMAPGLTWVNSGQDGGELISAAATLGVAHPTGYPTYLILAHAFQQLPMGNLARRTSWLSAVSAIAAALVIRTLTLQLRRPSANVLADQAAGWIAGASFGFSGLVWSQAIIAEVYTLNALGLSFILMAIWRLTEERANSVAGVDVVLAIVVGLALGNHLTILALLPAYCGAILCCCRHQRNWRPFQLFLFVGFGAAIYLYLPLRASAQPPINWGGANSLAGFWWLVTASPYQNLIFAVPASEFIARLFTLPLDPSQYITWIGFGAGVVGAICVHTSSPVTRLSLLWTILVFSCFGAAFATPDYFVHFMPVYVAGSILIGLGLGRILDSQVSERVSVKLILTAGTAILLVYQVPITGNRVSARRDQSAEVFLNTVLSEAPLGALVITQADRDTFAMWYGRFALRRRADLVVVAERLWPYGWYRDNLRAVYQGLAVPSELWKPVNVVASANNLILCRTTPDPPYKIRCALPTTSH